jgi:hypothetical protein
MVPELLGYGILALSYIGMYVAGRADGMCIMWGRCNEP